MSAEDIRRAKKAREKREEKEEKKRQRQAADEEAAAGMTEVSVDERLRVVHADFREALAGEVAEGSVDLILTDPPYSRDHLPLYPELGRLAARVLKPGGRLAVMVGQSYLPEALAAFSEHLSYHWTIAYLTPGGQASQLWERRVNAFWKPVLVFAKGSYGGEWFGDVAKSAVNDNDKDFHHWGQSESGTSDLLERLSSPGDFVVDPFCGDGTTAVVAAASGRRFFGSDKKRQAFATTRRRLQEATS